MNRLCLALMAFLVAGLGGCDLVGDVLEFGFWLMVITLLLIVGVGYWIYTKVRGPRR